ncbi:hypothetical protein QTP88_018420 [Uroleucon formosanum]
MGDQVAIHKFPTIIKFGSISQSNKRYLTSPLKRIYDLRFYNGSLILIFTNIVLATHSKPMT